MHPDFLQQIVNDRQREIEERSRLAFDQRASHNEPVRSAESVVLRLCCVGDDAGLERLAALEGKPVPKGRQIIAEVGGEVVVALPLSGGTPLADPFRPTSHLLPLLELRAKQLNAAPARRHAAIWGAVRSWSRA